jgi:hypothetical protein
VNANPEPISRAIEAYQVHFDAIYVAGIPNLLCDSGAFLSFMAVLTATDTLAGLFEPAKSNGDRFKAFVNRFFPPELASLSGELWAFRNAMVHSFNPGPFAITHHNSRSHLSTAHGPILLNAEDFYSALLYAYRSYFAELNRDKHFQDRFLKRVSQKEGGAPETYVFSKPL